MVPTPPVALASVPEAAEASHAPQGLAGRRRRDPRCPQAPGAPAVDRPAPQGLRPPPGEPAAPPPLASLERDRGRRLGPSPGPGHGHRTAAAGLEFHHHRRASHLRPARPQAPLGADLESAGCPSDRQLSPASQAGTRGPGGPRPAAPAAGACRGPSALPLARDHPRVPPGALGHGPDLSRARVSPGAGPRRTLDQDPSGGGPPRRRSSHGSSAPAKDDPGLGAAGG